MVVIPGPVEFMMGSPKTEPGRVDNEGEHKKRIGRTFALAAKVVTVAEFQRWNQRFNPAYGEEIKHWSPTGTCPVIGTSWFQAAEYCNWLSKQEGLPESEWCYEPFRDPKALPALAGSSVCLLAGSWGPLAATCGLYPGRTDPEYKVGMKLAANYLHRTGYRLPTEAEIEYATRAGSVTARYFGETEELLPKYAWYSQNSRQRTWPVGSLKPNDFGMFDVLGNVWEWCQNRLEKNANSNEKDGDDDEEDVLSINLDARAMRGGSYSMQAPVVRSADRYVSVPSRQVTHFGFRVARTFRR